MLIAEESGYQTYHVDGPFLALAIVLIGTVLLVAGIVRWIRHRRSRSTAL